MSNYHRRVDCLHREICIGVVSYQTEPHNLLTYFEQFGPINHYSFSSPSGGGYVFITYENVESVNRCMVNRPHRVDGRYLHVKRAIPYTAEYPQEHIELSRDIMIISDFLDIDDNFLKELREYFSSYGTIYACKYCHEANFDYFLVEFADYDQVDRVILDKPHYFNQQELQLMKYIATNKTLMNIKYSSKETSTVAKDAIDVDDDQKFLKFELNFKESLAEKQNDYISEIDLRNEIHRLQNVLKRMNDDFINERKKLEDNCCEQLKKLNDDADKLNRLQQDLEQEYRKLLCEHEALKHENELLHEQYLTAELENFELTSYYEQILAEEKAKTAQYETEYTRKLECLYADGASPLPPAIPDDDD
ncbi:unnamed protein product [Adineta ricciae]|uniref:RRM domain-containing protein n=1 Tax=Adineta ricciae TaxID=249248 RepID=A0A816A185_ADIRI|nr:unnamed protein product [Adineta ricciae]CAF1589775.1 unnamed protein product [Adineta ricciae]